MSDLRNVLRGLMYPAKPDPSAAAASQDAMSQRFMILDDAGEPVLDSAGEYEHMSLRMDAVAIIQQWIEEDDLDEGESSADRLLAMMVGVADDNQDGELDEDENDVVDVAREAAWDYLSALGVDDEEIGLLLDDWDDNAAERIRDAVAEALPDGEDLDSTINDFTFDDSDQEPVFDATYRKKTVVRGGKKKRVKKRVAGNVRLSGKQKLAIRKARKKAHNPRAKARRLKSMKVRKRMGK
ncbi:hypothetical protein L0636_00945 [Halomonas janggokensis]|uniref:Uncharacterized protein n=1 Tax=Vreelandella janggokensis TaxID=370767 RepID=A0ABT4IS09_9GAMM|nr:hypothetical protein [Halomonas janggokensis]MCZ0926454.1 hypothetical protein [Halomonas janggokensis]MCZ0928992.1 hypothetical protein [Halomonas janggokensis]